MSARTEEIKHEMCKYPNKIQLLLIYHEQCEALVKLSTNILYHYTFTVRLNRENIEYVLVSLEMSFIQSIVVCPSQAWMGYYTQYFYVDVITDPCHNLSYGLDNLC